MNNKHSGSNITKLPI